MLAVTFVDPNPALGNQFGHSVVALSTGNVVITAPFDDAGGVNAGAVYLFDDTGGLLRTFTGPNPDRIWLNIAYTYNDFRYDNDATFGNNRLPGAPPHLLRAELLYKHPAGFSFGPNIEWIPVAYYVDSANTLTTEPYLLWGLKAAYDDDKRFSAYVEGRNLSDKAYIAATSVIDRATPTSRLFNPGTGRSVFAGIRYRM